MTVIRNRAIEILYRLARTPFFGRWIGAWLAGGAYLIPFHRLAETETLIVIRHPRPCYRFHALALPKAAVRDFESSSAATRRAFVKGLTAALPKLFRLSGTDGLCLVLNGGTRQDVAQLHAHVIDPMQADRSAGIIVESSGTLADCFDAALAILDETRDREGFSIQFDFLSPNLDRLALFS